MEILEGLGLALIGKMSLFYVVFGLVMYLTGSGVSRLLKMDVYGIECFSIGLLIQLGVVQLLCWPFMWLKGSVQLFTLCILLISISGMLLHFFLIKRKYVRKGSFKKEYLLALAMLLLQVALTYFLYREDADDSFYVSNVTLFQNSVNLNAYDSSFGISTLGTVPMYDFETWEAYIAVWGNLFGVEGVTMMHFVLLPMLLLLSASAYLFLGRILFEGDSKKGSCFFILLSLFHFMGGNAVFSQGSFLLSRIWQGKSLYLHVVLPLMIGFFLLYLNSDKSYKPAWSGKTFAGLLSMCILSGMALNPTSLYVLGFQLIAMLIIVACYNKKFSVLLQGLPAIGIIVFFTSMIYLRVRQYEGQIEAASDSGDHFVFLTFKNFLGSGWLYFVVFIVAVLIIMLIGNREAKAAFFLTPMLLFIIVWNPLSGKVVAETLTKVPSYWRVFWLIPLGMAISYASIRLAEKFGKKWLLLLGCMVLILPGTWMFSDHNHFKQAKNVERIPTEVLLFGQKAISEKKKPVILSSDSLSSTFRQKYPQIELIYSRYQYILDLFSYRGNAEEGNERIQLMNFSNGADVAEISGGITPLIKKYHIDYIIMAKTYEENCKTVEKMGGMIVDETAEFVMYRYP